MHTGVLNDGIAVIPVQALYLESYKSVDTGAIELTYKAVTVCRAVLHANALSLLYFLFDKRQ